MGDDFCIVETEFSLIRIIWKVIWKIIWKKKTFSVSKHIKIWKAITF